MRAPTLAIAVVLAAALATPHGSRAQPELGPLCADVAKGMGVDPTLVAGFVSSFPEPPAFGFCDWLTKNRTKSESCDFLALMHYALTGGQSTAPPECYTPNTTTGQVIPVGGLTQLNDARPLPRVFPDPAAVYQEEGASFYWLFQTHTNVLFYTPCAATPAARLALPPGWAVAGLANKTQAGGPPLPLLYVLENTETEQLLFMVRSTLSDYEWSLDFAFNQTTGPEVEALFGSPAAVQSGFYAVFAEIWPTARAVLDDLIAAARAGAAPPELWVAGHSMGSAVGKMLAYAAQDHLNKALGEGAPLLNGVFFAPPQFGTPEFAARYDRLVNSRDVDFTADIISEVPCVPDMPACAAETSGLLGALGIQGLPTNQGDVASWPYATTGGSLPFTPQDMPQDTATWSQIKAMPLCWANRFLAATHSCSYTCYTSAFAPEPVADNNCWLSAKPAGAAGSQCFFFPNAWLGGGAAQAPVGVPAPEMAPPEPEAASAPSPAATDGSPAPAVAPPPAPASGAASWGAPTQAAALVALLAALMLL